MERRSRSRSLALGLALGATAALLAPRTVAGQQRFALGVSFLDEIGGSAGMLVVGSPVRSLAEPSSRWSISPSIGIGVMSDDVRQRDLPFAGVSLELGRKVAEWTISGQRMAIATVVGGGFQYAAPFESVQIGGQTYDFGRNGLWIPVARFEALGLMSLGGQQSSAIVTYSVGRIQRFSERGEAHGLGDRWYVRFGIEVSTR